MKSTMLVGRVENGQMKLVENARLPDNGLVYVVVPESGTDQMPYIASPRLVRPEQAADFELEVVEGTADAGV